MSLALNCGSTWRKELNPSPQAPALPETTFPSLPTYPAPQHPPHRIPRLLTSPAAGSSLSSCPSVPSRSSGLLPILNPFFPRVFCPAEPLLQLFLSCLFCCTCVLHLHQTGSSTEGAWTYLRWELRVAAAILTRWSDWEVPWFFLGLLKELWLVSLLPAQWPWARYYAGNWLG